MVVEQLGCIAKVLWADKEATDADVAWLAATSAQAGASGPQGTSRLWCAEVTLLSEAHSCSVLMALTLLSMYKT